MVNVSKEVGDFAWKNKMAIVPCEENVVYIFYYNDICDEVRLTAKLVSLIKKDNPFFNGDCINSCYYFC